MDFDGTITSHDTNRLLIFELIKLRPWRALLVLGDLVWLKTAAASPDRVQLIKNRCVAKLLRGLSLSRLDSVFSCYAAQCSGLFRAELISAIQGYAQQGIVVVVSTASMKEAVARALSVFPVQVIGAQFPMSQDSFNGAQPIELCYGEAKVQAIQRWAQGLNQEPTYIEAWSDSLSDFPMMRMAQKRFWVCTEQGQQTFRATDPGGEVFLVAG
jgi:phosphatidylglycerophosphatase C